MRTQTARADALGDLAEQCLGFLAENPDQLAAFMVEAGYAPDAFRAALGSRALALGLLDHFARNEALLLAFCANAGLAPEDFMRVWARHNPAG